MQTKNLCLVVVVLCTLASCKNGENKESRNIEVADSTTSKIKTLSGATDKLKDSTRAFIRTADLKFRVKNIINTTYDIENITSQQGGFVTYTNLTSQITQVTNTAISADSSLETTHYLVTNTITLRVPNNKLDTTIKEIARNIEFLDYRIIKAEDVALSIITNNLTQKRATKAEERMTQAIDNKGKKFSESALAEETILKQQEEADNAKIANLTLRDQIAYSTIQLQIYQRETVKREVLSNEKNITAYQPSFGKKILESLLFGWEIVESIIITIVKLWAIILFVVAAYWIYQKLMHKQKK